jgi:hypothetical protein
MKPSGMRQHAFVIGTAGTTVTIVFDYPPPFVPVADKVNVFSGAAVSSGKFSHAGGNIRNQFVIDSSEDGKLKLTGPIPLSGIISASVPYNDSLLKTSAYIPIDLDATSDTHPTIPNNVIYDFTVSAGGVSDTKQVTGVNNFKKIVGIGGLTLDSIGNPLPGVNVVIKSGTVVKFTGTTDTLGFYHWNYKHTGKNIPVVIELTNASADNDPKSDTLKSNGYLRANFINTVTP